MNVRRRLAAVLIALAMILLGDMAAHAQPKPVYPDRREFARRMARVEAWATSEDLVRLLGRPTAVLRHPDVGLDTEDEVWYWTAGGRADAPVIGRVRLRQGVVPEMLSAAEEPNLAGLHWSGLLAAMRYLHRPQTRPDSEEGSDDPLQLIRAANYLRPMGKDKALAVIGEYLRVARLLDPVWPFFLLRTLFSAPGFAAEGAESGTGGRPELSGRTELPSFGAFYVVLADDIPFSLCTVMGLGGQWWDPLQDVQYLRRHGRIRRRPLRPPDDPFPTLQRLLASSGWKALEKEPALRIWPGPTASALHRILALVRTAYETPEGRQPWSYPKPEEYARYHSEFLKLGARWDEKLQMYVRRDGSHGPLPLERLPPGP